MRQVQIKVELISKNRGSTLVIPKSKPLIPPKEPQNRVTSTSQ